MDCYLCGERNVGPDHEKTEKHRRNEVFSEANWVGSDDLFVIPRNYKPLYGRNLKVDNNAPRHQKALAADIKDVFETGITKENYVRFFHNLLWYEETIVRINFKNYNMKGVKLVATTSGCLNFFVPGLAEKRPSLLMGDPLLVKPMRNCQVIFEAVIANINGNYVDIDGLDDSFWDYYNQEALFEIKFCLSRLPMERMHLAVDSILNEGYESRVFPVKNPNQINPVPITEFYNIHVQSNPEQRLAVERIVAGAAGTAPYLLHGPPGTGKTVTVVEAVLQLVNKNADNRILVCTGSNMAADHVASMLLQYAHMVGEENLLLRANSKHRVWEMLPESLYGVSNGTNFYDYYPLSIEDFMSYRIVVTTLTHSAKFSSQFQTENQPRPITHLFIDEAAQSSEPSCLIPTVGLLQRGGALVLAGDPLQLGPVVISPAARARGLGISLMERLKNTCPLYNDEDPDYTVMLVNNFRSHQDILHIPNQLFYNGQLKTYAAEDAISHTDILGEKSSSCAIVFHGVRSKEQRMGNTPSYYNTVEIQTVQVYVKRLIEDHGVQQEDIGIVTPYLRQVHNIRAWLHAQQLYNLEVGTVEAFQGQERRVIIVSTVRASCSLQHEARSQLGFLVDDKRFNVAVTRAKAKLIIIGNPLCLEKDLKWVAYMQQCRQFGSYRGFDPAAAAMDTTRIELLHRVAPIIKGLKTSSVKAQAPLETEHLETMDVDEEGKAVLKIEDRNQELETGETGPPSQIMEVEN